MITCVLGLMFLTFVYMLSPSLGNEPVVCVMMIVCTSMQLYLGILSIFVEFSNLLNIEFPSSMAPKTCTHGFQWSFTFSLTTDVVNKLAKKCKQIEALSFAHSFGIMNHV